ncbi:MAG: alkaline phosphatase family protein [Bacteroidota bacterium]
MSSRLPLVVVALDAADPDLLAQWAAKGHLPTLARIMDTGWWGRLAGPDLSIEHGAWVSLLSGRSRREHGYHYFRQLAPGSYDLELVRGQDVDARPFWADLSPGHRVAILDVPDMTPIPGVEGIQLADWAVHNPESPPTALPATILDEAQRIFGPQDPIEEHLRSTETEDRALFNRLLARIPRKGDLVRQLVQDGDFDLIVAGFGEVHTGGHQFWRYRPGGEAEGGPLTHAIRDLYAATDLELAKLLDAIGEANVVVLSSVGLRDQYPMTGISEAFFHQLGYQAAPEPSGGWPRPIDVARRLLPERIRIALSQRLSRDQREALLADQFRTGTDWSRTTAFSIPSAYATFVRVNLKGREPQGIVESSNLDALLDQIEADFRQLVDPETGEPVVERIERPREVFGADASDMLPDLFVHWRPIPRFLQRVRHPRAELVQDEPEFFRDSDHTRHGFIAASGPAFSARGCAADVDVLRVAPLLRAALEHPETPSGTVSPTASEAT